MGMTPRAVPSTPPSESTRSPAFLTVEEAAAVLRIGRTAAYALTRQWRATGGAEGLPVVRFGRLLRVPAAELERLAAGVIDRVGPPPVGSIPEPAPPSLAKEHASRSASRRARRTPDEAQPSLFPEAS